MLLELYETLLEEYGHQGWWPLLHLGRPPDSQSGSLTGYHPSDYSFPRTDSDRLEIAIGAILTQNTAWINAESALQNLLHSPFCTHAGGVSTSYTCTPEAILSISQAQLATLIQPSGYANKKATYIQNLCQYFIEKTPINRRSLLSVKGIGPETADCILLYGFNEPTFVVDSYARRLLESFGILEGKESYADVQHRFHDGLPRSVELYQEYHALIVEHGKNHYQRHPYDSDPFIHTL